jgi:hypothetical protein
MLKFAICSHITNVVNHSFYCTIRFLVPPKHLMRQLKYLRIYSNLVTLVSVQVKSAAVHLEGQDVIAHIIDKHF